jgi:hypothetical protein
MPPHLCSIFDPSSAAAAEHSSPFPADASITTHIRFYFKETYEQEKKK